MTKQQIETLSESLEEFNDYAMDMYKMRASELTEGDTEAEEIIHQYKVLFEQSTKLLNNINRLLSENYPTVTFRTLNDGELFMSDELKNADSVEFNKVFKEQHEVFINTMGDEWIEEHTIVTDNLNEKAVEELINNDKTKENERD